MTAYCQCELGYGGDACQTFSSTGGGLGLVFDGNKGTNNNNYPNNNNIDAAVCVQTNHDITVTHTHI